MDFSMKEKKLTHAALPLKYVLLQYNTDKNTQLLSIYI